MKNKSANRRRPALAQRFARLKATNDRTEARLRALITTSPKRAWDEAFPKRRPQQKGEVNG